MSDTPTHHKASEVFRERLVTRYTNLTSRIPRPDPGVDPTIRNQDLATHHVPRLSNDAALTAFAQLGALRLNAAHALISLIDSTHQYVLAEATKSLSLQSGHRHDDSDGLWLGSIVLPRETGVCEVVLAGIPSPATDHVEPPSPPDTPSGDQVVVINDLQKDARYQTRRFVRGGPQMRFYAGAPIQGSDGTKIGAFCVFDNKPRDGLSAGERTFMMDMSRTIMDHLESVRIQKEFERRNRLINGLEAFVQGLTEIATAPRDMATPGFSSRDGQHAIKVPDPSLQDSYFPKNSHGSEGSSMRSLTMWEMALPSGSKSMFSRAANIVRQSGDYDGVAFFYIASTTNSHNSKRGRNNATGIAGHLRRSSSSSSSPESSDQRDHPPPTSASRNSSPFGNLSGGEDSDLGGICPILGFSISHADEQSRTSDQAQFPRFLERDLQKLLGTRPRGRVYYLDRTGKAMPGDSSSSAGSGGEQIDLVSDGTTFVDTLRLRDAKKRASQVKSLLKLNPKARAFVCLPLWDYTRQRWFAFAICWIIDPQRDPGTDDDLSFLRVFGNSMTNALSHLDALEADKAKTSFVASISHELRSPLHGVLGATNFLYDSTLDRFQVEMVDSITSSGRTLLDTLEHVMDFTKINNFTKIKGRGGQTKVRSELQRKRKLITSNLTTTIDMSQLLEEVVEAVNMGFTVQHDFLHSDDTNDLDRPGFTTAPTQLANSRRSVAQRGRVRLILDIPYSADWSFETQPGAWRRVIANLVGNSLKYTAKGFIMISLRDQDSDTQSRSTEDGDEAQKSVPLKLTVQDSGIGMSNEFLQNHVFQPFTQEDSFAAGTGLGLSIVDQIVRSMDGRVDISSSRGVGTTMSVHITANRAKSKKVAMARTDPIGSLKRRARDLRILIVEDDRSKGSKDNSENMLKVEAEFTQALVKELKDWFDIDTMVKNSWSAGDADLIILLEPSFRLLELIRAKSKEQSLPCPPILIVAHDSLERSVLRDDVRIKGDESIVEVTYQPLGPRKLAKVLLECIQQSDLGDSVGSQDSVQSNIEAATKVNGTVTIPHRPSQARLERPATPEQSGTPSEEHDEATPSRLPSTPEPTSILCVDDNSLNLKLLTTFIKRKGIDFVEAVDGQEAFDTYKAVNGAFKCVLMDISMPVMDGVTATRQIREYEATNGLTRRPIIALTGLASAAARNEALEAGMDHFLTKPISFPQLGAVVSELQQAPPMPPKTTAVRG